MQLAWRDPGSQDWSRSSVGDVSTGMLLGGTGTGDWATSIIVDIGPDGAEHAWVVMGRDRYSSGAPIWYRQLSALDGAGGPTFGPLVALTPAGVATKRPDVAVVRRPDGRPVLSVVWTQKESSGRSAVRTDWMEPTGVPSPVTGTVLTQGAGHEQHGSFVVGDGQLQVVVKDGQGRVGLHRQDLRDLAAPWVFGGATVDGGSGMTAPKPRVRG